MTAALPPGVQEGEQEILSLISFLVYLAYLALGFIYYANQKRTGEDTENTLIILKMAKSH